MKINRIVACVVLTVSSAVLVSCGSTKSQVIVPPPVTDVYVAGLEISNFNALSGTIWKNGAPIAFSATPGIFNAIAVSGNDLYAAGTAHAVGAVRDAATYWKNGVAVALTDGTQVAVVHSIFVSGSDVYVAGGVGGIGPNLAAVYWKNGVKVPLTDGSEAADAFSIQAVGSDVYVAGFENKTIMVSPSASTIYAVAKYWKNGVPVELTDGTKPAAALSMFVSGSDVYVSGFACSTTDSGCQQAVYWKNGFPAALSTTSDTLATSITVSCSNVYAVGAEVGSGMLFWKNGTTVPLHGSGYTEATQVVVSGQDVYVAGVQSQPGGAYQAGYWKNGVPVQLSVDPNTAQSLANSIVVVTH